MLIFSVSIGTAFGEDNAGAKGGSADHAPGTPTGASGVFSDDAYNAIVQFYGYDDIPQDARVVERQDLSTHMREKFVFNGGQGDRVPGYLGLPKSGDTPFPVVLLIDGITGSKARWWEEDSWPHGRVVTEQLIGAGFAVLALDAQYHGERIAANDYESPGVMLFENHWYHRTREMFIQTTIEHRRAIDYLETRPEIDIDRIGALGLSMGAVIIFGLNASDSRVGVSVAGVVPLGIFESEALAVISPYRLANGVGRRPFLMLMGSSDGFYSEANAASLLERIEGNPKEMIFYDSGHRLPSEYGVRVRLWFEAYLK